MTTKRIHPSIRILSGINSVLPLSFQMNKTDDKKEQERRIQDNQREKAKLILQILFNNVPYLLQEARFAKDFYNEMLK